MNNKDKIEQLDIVYRDLMKERQLSEDKEIKIMLTRRLEKVSQAINQLVMESMYGDEDNTK